MRRQQTPQRLFCRKRAAPQGRPNFLVGMMELAAENAGESADVSADKFVVSMEVTKYNGVGEIKVPQDILDSAAEIEG